ncbi:MAG TPA: ADP-ribosylglycohydrolase [Acholeplasmataceae bacterium]|jgi:type I restriction enzyme M protein|nr:ADP-ribosylglycohydrolase [Acholeplasmataceae bacterium]
MIGAIIGDIIGSIYEWNNYRAKDFKLFGHNNTFTDDTVMTIAIARAFINLNHNFENLEKEVIKMMQKYGRLYPFVGYGRAFNEWLNSDNPQSYNSYGNGAAMRISSVSYVGKSIDEVKKLSYRVTKVTHNHKEGLRGAEAVAVAIYLARTGTPIHEIKSYINRYYYSINFTIDSIRPIYQFDESCQGSVPQALECFFESYSFEDAIRNAISIGGDSDTIAAIAGSVAGAYYKIPNDIKEKALSYLDARLLNDLKEFNKIYK